MLDINESLDHIAWVKEAYCMKVLLKSLIVFFLLGIEPICMLFINLCLYFKRKFPSNRDVLSFLIPLFLEQLLNFNIISLFCELVDLVHASCILDIHVYSLLFNFYMPNLLIFSTKQR